MSAGTAIKQGTTKKSILLHFVPLKKTMQIINPATSMVTDILGSKIMSRQMSSPAPNSGKIPKKLLLLRVHIDIMKITYFNGGFL